MDERRSELPISDAEILASMVSARRDADRQARALAADSTPAAQELRRLASAGEASDTATHTAFRKAEAAARTEQLEELVEALRTMTAEIKPVVLDFETARTGAGRQAFDPGDLERPEPLPELHLPAPPPGLLAKVLPSSRVRHEEAVKQAHAAHERALTEHAGREGKRRAMLAEAMAEHERSVAELESSVSARNRRIDALRAQVDASEPGAVAAYFAALLAAGDYPPGFPRKATVAYDASSRMLVVDYELPGLDAVPGVQAVRYDSSSDSLEEVPRPASRRRDLYAVVVASTALRSVQELFDADRSRAVDSVAFNGYVHGVDRVTGEAVRPYLVSFKTRREEFRMLEIARTDPIVAMRTLDAEFSTNPADLAPVKQVVGVRSLGHGAILVGSPL